MNSNEIVYDIEVEHNKQIEAVNEKYNSLSNELLHSHDALSEITGKEEHLTSQVNQLQLENDAISSSYESKIITLENELRVVAELKESASAHIESIMNQHEESVKNLNDHHKSELESIELSLGDKINVLESSLKELDALLKEKEDKERLSFDIVHEMADKRKFNE